MLLETNRVQKLFQKCLENNVEINLTSKFACVFWGPQKVFPPPPPPRSGGSGGLDPALCQVTRTRRQRRNLFGLQV